MYSFTIYTQIIDICRGNVTNWIQYIPNLIIEFSLIGYDIVREKVNTLLNFYSIIADDKNEIKIQTFCLKNRSEDLFCNEPSNSSNWVVRWIVPLESSNEPSNSVRKIIIIYDWLKLTKNVLN